jgi:hypothetical protein
MRQQLPKRKKERKIKRSIPLTSEVQFVRTRKEINATNRRRGKEMERRVAKFLDGARTPMSGAAAKFKGDVTVDFINNPGKYIIECKLSDGTNGSNQPQVVLQLKWFAKIQQEAAAMRAKFGVLIIHYHGFKNDYVFVRSDHLDWIFTKSKYSMIIDTIIGLRIIPKDIMRFANGKLRTLYGMEMREIEQMMIVVEGFRVAAVNTPDGTYYIFDLQQFRDLMEGI